MVVKVLNVGVLASGNSKAQDMFCNTLTSCLATQGFVKILNYSMEAVVEEVFEWESQRPKLSGSVAYTIKNKPFFALLEETKK